MARFEQVVLSNDDDEYGIPRYSGVAVINTDEIQTVEAGMRDTIFAADFDPRCPRGYFPFLTVAMRGGDRHTLLLGQYDAPEEAEAELERFTRWLTGQPILL